jgi:general secretion pathway protein M
MLKNLSKREKIAVTAAAVVIIVVALAQYVITPILNEHKLLKRNIRIKTQAVKEMRMLQTEYNNLARKTEQAKHRFANRKKDFRLFSFLEKLAGEAGVKSNITNMKPSTSTSTDASYTISKVEMKLQAVTLNQITAFLHKVETTGNMVVIRRLSLSRTGKKKPYIDAILQVETITL